VLRTDGRRDSNGSDGTHASRIPHGQLPATLSHPPQLSSALSVGSRAHTTFRRGRASIGTRPRSIAVVASSHVIAALFGEKSVPPDTSGEQEEEASRTWRVLQVREPEPLPLPRTRS